MLVTVLLKLPSQSWQRLYSKYRVIYGVVDAKRSRDSKFGGGVWNEKRIKEIRKLVLRRSRQNCVRSRFWNKSCDVAAFCRVSLGHTHGSNLLLSVIQ